MVLFDKMRSTLGVAKCVISGGGTLAPHLEDFYEVLGLPVLNGYGSTEVTAHEFGPGHNPMCKLKMPLQ